jgi:hypothetical protein
LHFLLISCHFFTQFLMSYSPRLNRLVLNSLIGLFLFNVNYNTISYIYVSSILICTWPDDCIISFLNCINISYLRTIFLKFHFSYLFSFSGCYEFLQLLWNLFVFVFIMFHISTLNV